MSGLVVFEGELERASRDVGEVGAELANPRLDECRAAEDLAMPGGSQADLTVPQWTSLNRSFVTWPNAATKPARLAI